MQRLTRLVLAFAIAAAGPASAWTAINGSEVIPTSGDRFEVINRASSRAQDYWCAAGEYVVAALRRPVGQRIYIHTGVGPSQTVAGRRAVQFSLSVPPGGPAPQTYSLGVSTVGDSLPAAMARQYCLDRLRLRF